MRLRWNPAHNSQIQAEAPEIQRPLFKYLEYGLWQGGSADWSADLHTEGLGTGFQVRAHTDVAGLILVGAYRRGN